MCIIPCNFCPEFLFELCTSGRVVCGLHTASICWSNRVRGCWIYEAPTLMDCNADRQTANLQAIWIRSHSYLFSQNCDRECKFYVHNLKTCKVTDITLCAMHMKYMGMLVIHTKKSNEQINVVFFWWWRNYMYSCKFVEFVDCGIL